MRVGLTGLGAGCLALFAACGADEADETSAESAERAAADSEYDAAEEFRSLRAAMSAGLVDALMGDEDEFAPRVRREVEGASGVTDRLIWAAGLPKADWGFDYEKLDHETLMDQLAFLCVLGRLLRVEGLHAEARGDTERAVEAITALVRLSKHIDGETGIESISAIALLYSGVSATVEIAPSLNEEQRATLRGELQRMSGDPFNIARAIEFDRRMLAGRSDVELPDCRMRTAASDVAAHMEAVLRALR